MQIEKIQYGGNKTEVFAVKPYIYEGRINFKYKPYFAWESIGGKTKTAFHFPKFLHGIEYNIEFPRFFSLNGRQATTAILRFVQPYSLRFDTFPDYMFHEIIPFFWDVWPKVFDKTVEWLRKYQIKTAIFTCRQVADEMKIIFPRMNIMWCPEGIDVETYEKGKSLDERSLDYLEYGRKIDHLFLYNFPKEWKYVRGQANDMKMIPFEIMYEYMKDAKTVSAYPSTWTNPERSGKYETLTQRYWECMLSRIVMIGHAPDELVDYIGYNPVVEVDIKNHDAQIIDIVKNISNYQELVDRNRKTALKLGDWKYRMKDVYAWLVSLGYNC